MQGKFILKLLIVCFTIFVLVSIAVNGSDSIHSKNTVANNQLFSEPQVNAQKTVTNLNNNKGLEQNLSKIKASTNGLSAHRQNIEANQFKKVQPSASYTPLNKRTFNPKPPLAISKVNTDLLSKKNLIINLPFIGETKATLSQEKATEKLTHAVFRFTDKKGLMTVSFNDGDIKELTILDGETNRVFTGNQANDGSVIFREKNIDSFICNDFEHVKSSKDFSSLSSAAALAEIEDDYFPKGSVPTFAEITTLQSKPSVANSKVIYIDNLGGIVENTFWNDRYTNGEPINYDPFDTGGDTNTFDSEELKLMYAAWAELAEDYAPFEVNVTTDIAVYNAAAEHLRSRLIATNSNAWIGNTGGVALVNTFGFTGSFCSVSSEFCSIGWSFNSSYNTMGMTHSHESGHQMGLKHDGDNNRAYYSGNGNWGPIMGGPFGKDFVQWSNGSYPDATHGQDDNGNNLSNTDDDYAIISSKLGVSADDVGNTNNSATALEGNLVGLITPKGSGSTIDKDVFTFDISGSSTTNITVRSLFENDFTGNGGINLSAKISLKNAIGTTIEEKLPTSISTNNNFEYSGTLASGTYYLTIEPQSYDSNLATGFNEYGNGGYYQIISNIGGVQVIPPDLIVSSTSSSSLQVSANSPLTLNATVQNIGEGSSTPTNLRYQLYSLDVIDSANPQVGISTIESLAVNGISSVSINITAPDRPGEYLYEACVDTVAGETETNNNCSSTNITISVTGPATPDLIVSSFSTNQNQAFIGEALTLSATTQNIGESASNASTLRYYRSTDSTITTNDTSIGTTPVNGLNVIDEESNSISINVPNTTGTYYYGACVDKDTNETAVNNNCSTAVAVNVVSPPDLTVPTFSTSVSTTFTGKPIILSASTRNIGGFTSNNTRLRYYRSTDSTISTNDTFLGTDPIGGLSVNAFENDLISTNVPNTTGTYYYGACVDNDANETITNNNCSIGVAVNVVSPPDLIIEHFAPSSTSISFGATLTLSATIKNNGGYSSSASDLRYYRSVDNVITTNDQQVEINSIGILEPSDNETSSTDIAVPNVVGTYYYGVCVDSVTNETADNNNCSQAIAVTVIEQTFPDLLIDKLNVSKLRVTTETPLDIAVIVQNSGSESSTATSVKFYISNDNIISFEDEEVASFNISALNINSSAIESTIIDTPNTIGDYYFGACVVENENEQDINNNCSEAVLVEVIQGYTADSYETDNNSEQSKNIRKNETQTHNIHTLDDEDWLTFKLTKGVKNLAIVIDSLNANNIKLELFDESLNSVAIISDASLESLKIDSLATGTYYLQVRTIDGNNAIESYEISLRYDDIEDEFCFPIKAKNGKVVVICL